MRILLASHVARASGAEIVLARLAHELSGTHDVHVVFLEEGPLAEDLRAGGIDVHVVGTAAHVVDARKETRVRHTAGLALGSAGAVRSIRRFIATLAPDLVHAHSLKSGLLFGSAARSLGVPFLWHVHDRIARDYLGYATFLAARAGLRVLPDAVAVNSRAAGGSFRSRGVRSVTPNPVALLGEPRAGSPTGRRFGLVGRITRWKGQDVAVRALLEAFPEGAESLDVIGDAMFGEEAFGQELRALVAGLRLESRVRFRGHVTDVGAALQDVDVLVHSSTLPEPFGLVIFEALRMGIPVIAADAGGPAEHLRHEETALLVPPGDPVALAAAMRRMRDDDDLRCRLARDGKTVGDRFEPSHAASAVEALYAQISGRC